MNVPTDFFQLPNERIYLAGVATLLCVLLLAILFLTVLHIKKRRRVHKTSNDAKFKVIQKIVFTDSENILS